jgi:hypothetical protein
VQNALEIGASTLKKLSRRNFLRATAGALAFAKAYGREAPLFALREMDMHLHAGLERDEPDMDKWIDLAVADGRRAMVLVDHMEFYRRKEPGRYPHGAEGHKAFMAEIETQIARRPNLLIFKGWEINQSVLDLGPEALEAAPMHMVETIGWHIDRSLVGKPPDGQLLIKRIKQLKELRKEYPVPMMLYHPFHRRIANLIEDAKKTGGDAASVPFARYRFFQPGEMEEVISLLKGSSIYLEMCHGQIHQMRIPVCREALIADIKPLAEAGLQFTVSTDNHYLKSAQQKFDPNIYCEPIGVTPQNSNSIIHELVSIRRAKAGRP